MLRIKYSYSKQSNTELKWTQWPHLPTNPIQLLVSCADIWHKNQMWCTAWEKQHHHLNCLLQQASFKITLFCLFFSKWLSNWIICYLFVWLLVYYCKAITITLSPNFFLGIKSTFYKLNLFPRAYSRLLLLVRMDLTGETWKEYTLDFFFFLKSVASILYTRCTVNNSSKYRKECFIRWAYKARWWHISSYSDVLHWVPSLRPVTERHNTQEKSI